MSAWGDVRGIGSLASLTKNSGNVQSSGFVNGGDHGVMSKTINRLGVSRRWFIAAGGTAVLDARRRLASAQSRICEVKWVGASRDVVRGDLTPRISLESLMPVNHLYAVGPPEGLRGEITIIDSQPYVSRIEDGRIVIDQSFRHRALFLVWVDVEAWRQIPVPRAVRTYRDVETFVAAAAGDAGLDTTRPFPFLLQGTVARLGFHIFNKGDDAPHSPEAHERIKVKFAVEDVAAEMIGFWSDKHEGIFIPSGRTAHLHFRTSDTTMTGHVDELELRSGSVLALPRV
ncbi:MAG TPA: acetolactate decarboxylase [Vicinamibacterales bacterium]|nr:acetolactate decarboxylase [Vicinamibacterales bacterium]